MIVTDVRVNLFSAEALSCSSIPKNAVGLKVRFQYADPLWNTLSKTAVFRNSIKTLNSILIDDCAVIPHELLCKTKDPIYVGLYGTDSNRSIAIPTVWAKLGEVSSSAIPSSSATSEATLPYWAQIQEKVDSLEQEMMVQEDLDCALQQAKESGAFDGPQGPKGDPGEQGATGPAGYTPILGADYWTTEDKNAITTEAANIATNLIQHSSEIICTTTGPLLCLNDAANRELHGLKLYGKTMQKGTPTPDVPVELESVGDGGTITVKNGISKTDMNPQILTAQTPNGLPGIPVTSGGNYTDENGQQWICDEIDFARGKYVQKVRDIIICNYAQNTFTSISVMANTVRCWVYISVDKGLNAMVSRNAVLCDKLPYNDTYSSDKFGILGGIDMGYKNSFVLWLPKSAGTTAAEIKAYLDANPLRVLIADQVATETDLTAEEVAQYSTLHTNYPNTTIYNDEGAGMEVSYVADTKLYIDRRISELTALE